MVRYQHESINLKSIFLLQVNLIKTIFHLGALFKRERPFKSSIQLLVHGHSVL